MNIEQVPVTKIPHSLLLLADEDDDQIAVYRDTARFYAAVEQQEVLGHLGLVQHSPERFEIVTLAVEPGHQRQGIATSLLERAIDYSRENGCRELLVKTGACGTGQLALYQRCGFRIVSVQPDYFLEHYHSPIYENGIRCTDQVTLRYRLYTPAELQQHIREYWQRFLKRFSDYKDRSYDSWCFCYGEYLPNLLIGLVKTGKKRGTSSALELYGPEERVPQVGDLVILTYGNGLPGCIIETKECRVKSFEEITEEEAALEGEGDLSLEYWRRVHRHFFSLEYQEQGRAFTETIPVLFERFEVLYDEDCL